MKHAAPMASIHAIAEAYLKACSTVSTVLSIGFRFYDYAIAKLVEDVLTRLPRIRSSRKRKVKKGSGFVRPRSLAAKSSSGV